MPSTRQPRSDAQANRIFLLDAALEIFTEQGVAVALDAIAERAGVSRATLYRNFPDREALLREALLYTLERLAAEANKIKHRDAGTAFFEFLRVWGDEIAQFAPLTDYWRSLPVNSPLVLELRERLGAIAKPLIREAVSAGQCRDDLGPDDLVLIVGIFSSARRGRNERERLKLSSRAWELIISGLRPRSTPDHKSNAS